MENLGENHKNYIKLWNDGDFVRILNTISNEDLKIISSYLNLNIKFISYVQNFHSYHKVINHIRNKDQLKILIAIDINGIFDISINNNKHLLDAILDKDNDLINLIINHRNFKYPPPIDKYSDIQYKWYEYSPMYYLIRNKNYEDYLNIIKYTYDSMDEKNKQKLLGDLIIALTINLKTRFIHKCIHHIMNI